MHGKEIQKSLIQCLVSKFEHTGSLLDDKCSKVAAKQTSDTLENIEIAESIIKATPRTSVTHLVQELGESSSSVYRILIIWLFLYKLQMLQTLSILGECKCICFAEMFGVYRDSHEQSLPYIWFRE